MLHIRRGIASILHWLYLRALAPLLGWVKGRRDARRDATIEDYEHAEDIRRRAADADQRLRDYDDAGWRD